VKACTVLRAANDSGPRRPTPIRHVVIHSTEGSASSYPAAPSAKAVAQFFAKPSTQASTQLVVDDRGCYRCVPDLVIPWGAPGVNYSGLHLELCAWARWDRKQWLEHEPMLRLGAQRAALWCWTFRIPRVWLSPDALRAGRAGILSHATASAVYRPGGHHDPGSGFPRDKFMQWTREAYSRLSSERSSR
jgi:hypothetical protein